MSSIYGARIEKIACALAQAALFGYGAYWCGRAIFLVTGWRSFGGFQFVQSAKVSVLMAVASQAVFEAALLIKDGALYALGDREESKSLPAHPSTKAILRNRCWRVIGGAEGLANHAAQKADEVFSRCLGIRTAVETKRKGDPTLKERIACAAVAGLKQALVDITRRPFDLLGNAAVAACGFAAPPFVLAQEIKLMRLEIILRVLLRVNKELEALAG